METWCCWCVICRGHERRIWRPCSASSSPSGALVRDEADRAHHLQGRVSSNGLLRTQQRLQENLRGQFTYQRAVSFANQGGQGEPSPE
jgi:hypothetical protein